MGAVKENKKEKILTIDYENLTEADKAFIDVKLKEGYRTVKKRAVSATSKMDKKAFIDKLKAKKLTKEATDFEAICNDKENGGFFTAKKKLRKNNPKAYYEILGKKGKDLKDLIAKVEAENEAEKTK